MPAAPTGGLAAIEQGDRYEFEVIATDPEKERFSLRLVGSAKEQRPHSATTPRATRTGFVVGDQAAYGARLSDTIAQGAESINRVGQQYANNSPASRAGFTTEADHSATFNVDASLKRSKVRASRLDSNAAGSPDIVVEKGSETVKEVSSKVYRNAQKSAKHQRGYGDQDRLIPSDHLEEGRAYAGRQAKAEAAKNRPARTKVAEELREVEERLTDRVEVDGVESTPRTREESREMGRRARTGDAGGKDVAPSVGRAARQGAKTGAKAGAVGGAAVTAAFSGYENVQAYRQGKKSGGDAAADFAVDTAKGAADGALKGAAAGATTAASRVLAERASSTMLRGVLRGNAPAAAAITGVEVAKHAIDLARGTIDIEGFKAAAAESAKGGAASYAGATLGGAIGGPVGMIVGGVAGPLVVSGAERVGLGERLARFFAVDTAQGHTAAYAVHLAAKNAAKSILDADDSAVVVFDRVVPGRGGRLNYASAVAWSRGNLYALDFKSWKGHVTLSDDRRSVEQATVSSGGNTYLREHYNPLPHVDRFSLSFKNWQIRRRSPWKRQFVRPLVVFCSAEASYEGFPDEGYTTLEELPQELQRRGTKASTPPKWLLDDLASSPTWDVLVDRSERIYQGMLQQDGINLLLENGAPISIPFAAIWRIEVEEGGFFSRADPVAVQLRDGQVVRGTAKKTWLSIRQGSYEEQFLLRDLATVIPSSSFFTTEFLRP